MKKVFGLFLALAFVFCLVPTAYAADASNDKLWDALSNPVLSGDAKMELSVQLNKPILLVPDMEETINLFTDSKLLMDMSFKIAEDGTAIESKMDMTIELPASIKEMLGVDLKMTVWLDYDMNENGSMYMVYTVPGEDVYYYYDIKMEDANELYAEMGMVNFGDMSEFKALVEKLNDAYKDSVIVTEADGVYNMVYTEEFLSQMMTEMFTQIYDMTSKMMGYSDEAVLEYADVLEELKLFADEAIVVNVTLDENGVVKTETAEVNVQFNVYDIMDTFGLAELDESITKENSDVDFTIHLNVEYTNVNTPVEIEFPTLTEENSIDFMEMLSSQDYIDDYVYDYENEYATDAITFIDYSGNEIVLETESFIEGNQYYIPLKDALLAVGVEESNIRWSNGTIYIVNGDTTISFKPNDERLFVNGEEALSLYTTVKMGSNSRSYITTEWLENLGIGEAIESYTAPDGTLNGGVILLYR